MMSELISSLAESIKNLLTEAITDLAKLEVHTVLGVSEPDPDSPEHFRMKETKALAYTKIDLDGDLVLRLPMEVESGEIDERLLKIHDANVKIAMENWRTFLETLVGIAKELAKLIT
jgi:hypothetical protein